uniref:Novel immune-type receptor 6b n=1 Tax=Cyprinus carpio TaxID=7962 RepID=A0A8C1J6L3_CYPCA
MIIWAILIFWVCRPDNSSEIFSLQTIQLGDDVTVKCFLTKKSFDNTMVWYKQSTDQIPRLMALSYNYWKDIEFEDEFKYGRFDISTSEDSFHLNIKATTKEDIGKYYCGTVFLNRIEFISGAHLMLKGKIYSTCYLSAENTAILLDPVLLCLISCNVVFVMVIILLVGYYKNWRKRQKGSKNVASPSYEIGDSDVNYAAVNLASVPPARRSNNRHLTEYSEVIYKPRDHVL